VARDGLIEIQIRNTEGADEGDLKRYLEEMFEVKVREEFVESVHWQNSALFLAPAAVPAAKYVGNKLIDVLAEKLRLWLETRPSKPEVVLYDADGNAIKIPRK
jgi:hypothetical protein